MPSGKPRRRFAKTCVSLSLLQNEWLAETLLSLSELDFSRTRREIRSSVQLLHPDVAHRNLGGRLDLYAEQAGLIVRRSRVVVDHHRHQLAVQNVDAGAAAGDDRVLVPVVHLDDLAEDLAVADIAHEPLSAVAGALNHLPAPSEDAHGGG